MKIIKHLTFGALAVLAATLLFQTSITRAAGSGPVRITFQKCYNPVTGTWEGTVDGDCGQGTVSYVDLPPFFGTKVQHYSGEYTVTTGECSFKAVASGQWNTQTGRIVLNGVVTQGSYAGGQVHVRAEWDGGNCTLGTATMTITPSDPE